MKVDSVTCVHVACGFHGLQHPGEHAGWLGQLGEPYQQHSCRSGEHVPICVEEARQRVEGPAGCIRAPCLILLSHPIANTFSGKFSSVRQNHPVTSELFTEHQTPEFVIRHVNEGYGRCRRLASLSMPGKVLKLHPTGTPDLCFMSPGWLGFEGVGQ